MNQGIGVETGVRGSGPSLSLQQNQVPLLVH